MAPASTGRDPAPSFATGRVPALDVMRGAAIVAVLAVHGPEIPLGAWGRSVDVFVKRSGWAGVDLFFALSGFLIMALLLTEQERMGRIDVRAFFVRRVFKIYPPYLVFLLGLAAWQYAHVPGSPGRRLSSLAADLWPALAHLQNYIPLRPAPHLWSLALEEHCYALLLVLALVHAARSSEARPSRFIPAALAGLFVASWLARLAHVAWSYRGVGPIGFTYTHHRIDALLAGALAAWLMRGRHGAALTVRAKALLAATAVACLLPTACLDVSAHRILVLLAVFPLQATGFGCAMVLVGVSSSLAGVPHGDAVRTPAWPVRALAFIGLSSYSTFLWHVPFMSALAGVLGIPRLMAWRPAGPALCLASFVGLSLGVGALMFWLIEKPSQGWRRHWLPVRNPRREARLRPAEVA